MAKNNTGEGSEELSLGAFSKIRANPWIASTIFLAIILLVVFIFRGSGVTGNVVSSEQAGENLLSFVKQQGDANAELVSIKQEGSLYSAVVKFKNQSIPVYITLDGNYLVSGVLPLNLTANADVETESEPEVPAKVSQSEKPTVDLFVMSLCPYGLQAEKGILPVVELLNDKIDFKLRFVSYIMHGKTEIDENTRQYCIQKEQSAKLNDYLKCFVEAGKSEDCLTKAKVDKAKLDSCIESADEEFNITVNYEDEDSWLSGRYPIYTVDAADNTKYKVQGSPTLVINGVQVSSARDSASLLKTICAAFTEAPSECSETLSSTAPSPGFGTAASSGSGSTAQCG
ncbi:MAG: hypothetical protein QXD13_01360 [Candidatus Pacearchaeota archaeon]